MQWIPKIMFEKYETCGLIGAMVLCEMCSN